jgi:hypothetical protein
MMFVLPPLLRPIFPCHINQSLCVGPLLIQFFLSLQKQMYFGKDMQKVISDESSFRVVKKVRFNYENMIPLWDW